MSQTQDIEVEELYDSKNWGEFERVIDEQEKDKLSGKDVQCEMDADVDAQINNENCPCIANGT